MKMKYNNAEIEVIELGEEDIITDSNLTPKLPIQTTGGADKYYSNDGTI